MTTLKKRKAWESSEQLFAAEEWAFHQKRAQLLQRYQDQFVAIYHGRVVGHGSDDGELARRKKRKLREECKCWN